MAFVGSCECETECCCFYERVEVSYVSECVLPTQGLCLLQLVVSQSLTSSSSKAQSFFFKAVQRCDKLFIIWNVFIKYLNVKFCPLLFSRKHHDKTARFELANPGSIIQWHRCSYAMRMCCMLWFPTARRHNIWRTLICVHTLFSRLIYVKMLLMLHIG